VERILSSPSFRGGTGPQQITWGQPGCPIPSRFLRRGGTGRAQLDNSLRRPAGHLLALVILSEADGSLSIHSHSRKTCCCRSQLQPGWPNLTRTKMRPESGKGTTSVVPPGTKHRSRPARAQPKSIDNPAHPIHNAPSSPRRSFTCHRAPYNLIFNGGVKPQ
jgi:hypothetical protein